MHNSIRSRSLLPIMIVAGIAVIAAIGFFFYELQADSLNSAINERFSQLDVKPNTIEFTYQKGLRVRNAILGRDFTTANNITVEVLNIGEIQNWRYYPFEDFMTAVFALTDQELGLRLAEWTEKDPSNSLPMLFRAQYNYVTGWAKRGHNFASKTDTERMAVFTEYIVKALDDVKAAINLSDRIPYSYYLKLKILQAGGASPAMKAAFEEAVEKYRTYYPLYDMMLSTLQPRWGGKIPAMYEFVEKYAGNAPEFSPLKLLYLSLYRHLLSTSSTYCTQYGGDAEKTAECVASVMQKAIAPTLEQNVLAALQLYDHTDKYQFGMAVRPIISAMLATAGGGAYSGAILQLAASSMHSDARLKEDKPATRNDYIIDELVAESWHHKGFYNNEQTKYEEAVVDARSGVFPSEEEKNVALALIFERLAEVAEEQHQYVDQIAFERAAVTIGVTWDYHYICFGYYQLKRYPDAVQACTEAINSTGNPHARFWRGKAYQDSGKIDEALQDFTKIADAEEETFAASAAIAISMIYFNRNDDQAALNVLNKYTFLYDPNRTVKASVAVGYNNRCYAHMQLGEFKKALEDCTQSLKYGSIPDAFRKQQELVKRLDASDK